MTITVANAQPNKIDYAVKTPTRELKVTVTRKGNYACTCGAFVLYGACDHVDGVKAKRLGQGRKF